MSLETVRMRLPRGLLVGLMVAALVGPAIAAPSSPAPAERAAGLPAAGTNVSADSTAIEIAVGPDGSAEWTVQYRVRLDDEATAEQFERAAADIEANPLAYTGPFTERMQEAADLASAETGRSMTVGNTTVHAWSTADGYGVVTYRFAWSDFAASSDGRLRIGDALVGFFIGSEGTSLVVAWPTGYDLQEVSPEPDETHDRSVVWRGRQEFGPNQPRVVVSGGLPVPLESLAGLALGLVIVAAVWRYRGDRPLPSWLPWPAAAGGALAGASADDDVAVPDELLSDPERVLQLVENNGGRMKQQAVVEMLEWSETKTSQVVNDLKEDGDLEVYRIGRENVLSLPGEMDV